MQILSTTVDHVSGAVTVGISYLVKSPFGDVTEQNSFQLTDEEAAAYNADPTTLPALVAEHLKNAGFVEVAP